MALALTLIVWAAGCAQDPDLSTVPRRHTPIDTEPSEQIVYRAPDRAGEYMRVVRSPSNGAAPTSAEREEATPADADSSPLPPTVSGHTVDAMVGQINGKPVYAGRILEEVGHEQLSALGVRQSREEFRNEVTFIFAAKLREKITNALVLAEAEAGLNEQEQVGLLTLLQQYREDTIARFGGSTTVTEAELRQRYGYGLEEAVEQRRQELLVQKYLSERLWPKVHVERREVERFYEKNFDRFNPKPQLKLEVLFLRSAPLAAEVEAALAAGRPFDELGALEGVTLREIEVAARLNEFNELAWPEVNQRVRALGVGEHTGRVDVNGASVWVALADKREGEPKALADVFLEVEQRLRAAEFDRLNRKYLMELLEQGNYTPVEHMLERLVTVATNRYALAE